MGRRGDLPPLAIRTNEGAISTPAEALFIYAQRLINWLCASRGEETHGPMPGIVRRHSLSPAEATPELIDLIDRRISLVMGFAIPWMLGET